MNIFTNVLLVLFAIWVIPWKIYAVWLAAKNDHKKWFVALVLINTFSILEIFYVFHTLKKSWSEVRADFKIGWGLFKEGIKFWKKEKVHIEK